MVAAMEDCKRQEEKGEVMDGANGYDGGNIRILHGKKNRYVNACVSYEWMDVNDDNKKKLLLRWHGWMDGIDNC